ncbi:MAG: hypothetical protein HOC71_08715 [Candidatus Latescibacteria bacterium]|jgi:tetratricopeptide (TPR) repeat protein|nr:hypothetical protein [Candidatus Latescibacterota bacterium]
MKKHNTILARIGFLAVVVIIVLGTSIYGQGTLKEAKKLMDDGQYRLSEAVFQALVQKDSQKADIWYWWGVCRVKQGYQDDEMFLKALGLKPKLSESIAPLYRQEAQVFLKTSQTDTARGLFDKAIEWDKDLRLEVAQYLYDSGHYELAVRYDSRYADKIADILYEKGEEVSGEASLSFYRKAVNYSSKYFEAIKAKLLAVSKTKFEEQDIQYWRNAASEFGSIPPNFKIYEPGTYTFSLKAGEKTDHWIMFPYGVLINYGISSSDFNYKLLYDDGYVVKDGKDVVYPNKTTDKFKIIAITDQPKITMKVIQGRFGSMAEK